MAEATGHAHCQAPICLNSRAFAQSTLKSVKFKRRSRMQTARAVGRCLFGGRFEVSSEPAPLKFGAAWGPLKAVRTLRHVWLSLCHPRASCRLKQTRLQTPIQLAVLQPWSQKHSLGCEQMLAPALCSWIGLYRASVVCTQSLSSMLRSQGPKSNPLFR
eukprot:2601133-Rhodomonas_salina.1